MQTNIHKFNRSLCSKCGICQNTCPNDALKLYGKKITLSELLPILLEDSDFYETSGGGVTLSGGEPLLQPDFLKECVALCKREGIHCAVETSLIFFDEALFRALDLVMADLKIWDDDLHRLYTGVGNAQIKENFVRLSALGVPIIARTPIIPEIGQEIDRISEFLTSLESVRRYELLPYHPIGNAKREAMGLECPRFTVPTGEYMEELKKYVFIR